MSTRSLAPGDFRDARYGAKASSWRCVPRRGRSGHFTTSAAIAARGCSMGPGNCPGAITCPYHGWSYRLSGELLGMPVRESFPGLDRSQLRTEAGAHERAVRFRVRLPDRRAAAAREDLGTPSSRSFDAASFRSMQPLGPMYIEHWDVDWKIAMDNYLESYHVPIGHPGLLPHVHARLRGSAETRHRRGPRHQLAARAALVRAGASACTSS